MTHGIGGQGSRRRLVPCVVRNPHELRAEYDEPQILKMRRSISAASLVACLQKNLGPKWRNDGSKKDCLLG
jgi:hypothetical protein